MTVRGVGTDIVEIERISRNIKLFGQKFLDRIFTAEEQFYCSRFHDPTNSYAARFAAKEAIVKALGTGFIEGISWLDVAISNDERGKPFVILSDSVNERFGFPQIEISLSHSKQFATAFAIWSE